MKFLNETRFPARLLRAVIDETRFAASVVARVCYSIENETIVATEDQPYEVSPEPWESPVGLMEADSVYRKGGVDIHVFGSAHALGGHPAPSVEVSVALDEVERRAVVSGERKWLRSGNELVPSPPVPFSSLPLSMENAYGGGVVIDGLNIEHPENPKGKGFYLTQEQAEGSPLPQIEDPNARVSRWDDRAPPVGFGFCALSTAARLEAAVIVEDGALQTITSRLFNTAFPPMVFPPLKPDASLRLSGFAPEGPMTLRIPAPSLSARVSLGDRTYERPLAIDQVGVDVDRRRVFIAYRFPFRYVSRPLEVRSLTLIETAR